MMTEKPFATATAPIVKTVSAACGVWPQWRRSSYSVSSSGRCMTIGRTRRATNRWQPRLRRREALRFLQARRADRSRKAQPVQPARSTQVRAARLPPARRARRPPACNQTRKDRRERHQARPDRLRLIEPNVTKSATQIIQGRQARHVVLHPKGWPPKGYANGIKVRGAMISSAAWWVGTSAGISRRASPRRRAGAWRDLARGDGPALSGHGFGRGQGVGRERRAAGSKRRRSY